MNWFLLFHGFAYDFSGVRPAVERCVLVAYVRCSFSFPLNVRPLSSLVDSSESKTKMWGDVAETGLASFPLSLYVRISLMLLRGRMSPFGLSG